jgi:hypothetical protein
VPVAKSWADLDLNFIAHPNTQQVGLKKDENAIIQAVVNLLLTNHYERPFHPEIGSNLRKQLFEPMDVATTLRIKQCIFDTINNFEPRVSLTELNVDAKEEENGYLISMKFFIINEEVERQTTFLLERTR